MCILSENIVKFSRHISKLSNGMNLIVFPQLSIEEAYYAIYLEMEYVLN